MTIRYNPNTDDPEMAVTDDSGNTIFVPNPGYVERTAEQWIAYQIGNLDVKEQSIDFILDDSLDNAWLDVVHQKEEAPQELSTSYTYKGRKESIAIQYPVHPEQRWQDVPAHLAEARVAYVTQRNDNSRMAERLIAQIIVTAKAKNLFYATADRAVRIDPETAELTNIFGWENENERNLLSARLCDRMEDARLLSNHSTRPVVC